MITDKLFYIIWRNKYIRNLVRNNVFKKKRIDVTLDYINDNHQYLSLLSNDDKILYDIHVFLEINRDNIEQYRDNKYRYLVNEIYGNDFMDIGVLPHHGVHKLSFNIDYDFKCEDGVKVPDSVHELLLYTYLSGNELNEQVDRFIYHLPSNLKILSIPDDYVFTKQCILPHTLEDLCYGNGSDSLRHLLVPEDKLFENCVLEVRSMDDIQWLTDKTWITSLRIEDGRHPLTVHKHRLHNQIKEITINHKKLEIEVGALPESMESLSINCQHRIVKGVIPFGTKSIYHSCFNQPLEHGLFPNSVDKIILNGFIKDPLQQGCLPSKLKLLTICYNIELQQSILPPTLEYLELVNYNQPLKPHVLHNSLKRLTCKSFNQKLYQHSLPSSLTSLDITKFSGSFVGPLENLSYLSISKLNQSISTLLSKTLDINILCNGIADDVRLHNTMIQRLKINCTSPITLPLNFFPLSLRHLDIYNLHIKSSGVINDSCVSFISLSPIINDSYIPPSVITINNKKRYL